MRGKRQIQFEAGFRELPQILHKPWFVVASLAVLSQIFFLVRIQVPSQFNFDELHYIPAARALLNGVVTLNLEHPPLGKWLIALGIVIFGDDPFGWRIMSSVFGTVTLVGIYFLAKELFKTTSAVITAVALTLLNQLLYVQARIAMLDTFLEGFLVWALYFFVRAAKPEAKDRSKMFLGFGIFIGLAISTKWPALPIWFAMIVLVVFRSSAIRLKGWQPWFYLTGLPIVVYFVSYLPSYLVNLDQNAHFWDLFRVQIEMWRRMSGGLQNMQGQVVTTHPYMSSWWSWPFLLRPIWYAFDAIAPTIPNSGGKVYRGIVLLGNPLIMWGGLFALVVCAIDVVTTRSRTAFFILIFYGALFFPWAFVPRKVAFYYYYYPAGMILGLAIAYAFDWYERGLPDWPLRAVPRWVFLGASLALFVYFFPVLSGLKITPAELYRLMWFSRWI